MKDAISWRYGTATCLEQSLMRKRIQTTDERYLKVGDDAWWDTTGVEIVREEVIDRYMEENRVGVMVSEINEEDMLGPSNH